MPVIGIDVSKAKLHVVVLLDPEGRKVRTKTVANQASGFSALLKFACHQAACAPPDLHVVMEATGVYHETAATYLFDQGATVSVVNPARVKDFAQSLAIQSKTDAQDAAVLARYGLLVKPAAWAPAPPEYRELKALLARRQAIEAQLRREQNRLEKAKASPVPPAVRDSLTQSLAFLKASRDRLTRSINDHIDRHPQLKQDKALLQSIPAVGENHVRRSETPDAVSSPGCACIVREKTVSTPFDEPGKAKRWRRARDSRTTVRRRVIVAFPCRRTVAAKNAPRARRNSAKGCSECLLRAAAPR